jgi:hypothetical protein
MKSKLSAALAAGACVLAVSPANAISVTSHRGVTTNSVPGAVLCDDFDSIQNTAIGTITGGLLCSGVDFGCGGLFGTPPATGNFLGVDSVDGTTTIATVTFTNPVSYAGFAFFMCFRNTFWKKCINSSARPVTVMQCDRMAPVYNGSRVSPLPRSRSSSLI